MSQRTSDPSPPNPTVWQIYKSRFLYTQAFILIAVGGLYLYKRNAALPLIMLVFLQFAAVYGAWMGKRLLDQIRAQTRNDKRFPDQM